MADGRRGSRHDSAMAGFDPEQTPAGWAAKVRCGHGAVSQRAQAPPTAIDPKREFDRQDLLDERRSLKSHLTNALNGCVRVKRRPSRDPFGPSYF